MLPDELDLKLLIFENDLNSLLNNSATLLINLQIIPTPTN